MRNLLKTRWRTGGDDRGDTLVEIIVSIVVMTTAGVTILGALGAAARSAGTHHRNVEIQSVLASASEVLQASNTVYVDCSLGEQAVRTAYQSAVDNSVDAADGATLTIVSPVRFWNGSSFSTTCSSASNFRLQQITIRATSGTSVADDLVVTKGS